MHDVRRLVVHRNDWGGWETQTPNRFERVFPFAALLNTKLGGNPQPPLGDLAEYVKVIEIPDPSALAFDQARPTDALPLRMSVAGLGTDLEPAAVTRDD